MTKTFKYVLLSTTLFTTAAMATHQQEDLSGTPKEDLSGTPISKAARKFPHTPDAMGHLEEGGVFAELTPFREGIAKKVVEGKVKITHKLIKLEAEKADRDEQARRAQEAQMSLLEEHLQLLISGQERAEARIQELLAERDDLAEQKLRAETEYEEFQRVNEQANQEKEAELARKEAELAQARETISQTSGDLSTKEQELALREEELAREKAEHAQTKESRQEVADSLLARHEELTQAIIERNEQLAQSESEKLAAEEKASRIQEQLRKTVQSQSAAEEKASRIQEQLRKTVQSQSAAGGQEGSGTEEYTANF